MLKETDACGPEIRCSVALDNDEEEPVKNETKETRLPLALELAEPKLIAGEVDIQLSSRTNTRQQSTTFSNRGVLSDISVDVAVDDVIA